MARDEWVEKTFYFGKQYSNIEGFFPPRFVLFYKYSSYLPLAIEI